MADNRQGWLILTTRYGKDIENPCKDDLSRALEEFRKDHLEVMTEGDYEEYSNAWLRCGTDDGPMYILSVGQDGTTSLSEFVSQDADDPVGELTKKISLEKALALWILLAEGNLDKVETELANDQIIGPE